MKRTKFLTSALILGVSLPLLVRAEDKPAKAWKNRTEASYVSTNGNSKSSTYAIKDTFTDTWKKTSLELIGGALGSDSQGQSTAEQYLASEKVAYSLSERNYTFEKVGWSKDRFSGVKSRVESILGLGRQIIKTDRDLLIGELGGGYTNEDRIDAPHNDFATGRAYSKYTHTFTPTATFSQDAEYLQNFNDPDDFRANTETALISALSVHLSLKVGYKWKYVGKPPVGFGRNDTTTSMALIADY